MRRYAETRKKTSEYADKNHSINFLFIGERNRLHLMCLGSNLYTLLERIIPFPCIFRLMPCEVAESKSKNKHQLSKQKARIRFKCASSSTYINGEKQYQEC